MEKVTLIVTVKNEARTLASLFESIESQTRLPDEVVISDGGSIDGSLKLLRNWKPGFPVHILQKIGNRSIGRNAAIDAATFPIIAIADAGCVLDKDWLKELLRPFAQGADVVAGYYQARAHTSFE